MIKQFINKLMGKTSASHKPDLGKRHVVPAKVHGINVDWVDERALNVVRTLQDRGFEAYIVGGAVRDLLLGLKPKDFDVATNPDNTLRAVALEKGWPILELFPKQ